MSLLTVMTTLAGVGTLLWFVNTNLPMDPQVKRVMNIAVLAMVILWLLKVFGLWGYLSNLQV